MSSAVGSNQLVHMNETTKPVADVYRAISAVTKALSRDGITKDKTNEVQKYKFRGIDDIYNALSAVLAGAELCILPRMCNRVQEERTTNSGGLLFYVTVEAHFDFVSARDGSTHTVIMYGEAMDSADKATNKAMSAAYKYACLQVFCIPTEGMAEDADATTHQVEPKPKVAKAIPPDDSTQLLTAIRDSLNTLAKQYSAAGHAQDFHETLGAAGYESIMAVPANRGLAQELVKTLKLRLGDLTRK